jgi:hypothetical protein
MYRCQLTGCIQWFMDPLMHCDKKPTSKKTKKLERRSE